MNSPPPPKSALDTAEIEALRRRIRRDIADAGNILDDIGASCRYRARLDRLRNQSVPQRARARKSPLKIGNLVYMPVTASRPDRTSGAPGRIIPFGAGTKANGKSRS